MVQLIIFDFDATLASTNKLIFDSFNFILIKYKNIKFSENELINKFGPPEFHLIVEIFGKELSQTIFEDYLQFYKSNHKNYVKLYPDIIELLEFLKSKNILLSIFTGKGKATTEISLEELCLTKYFDYICTGDDVTKFKPSSEGIIQTMHKLRINPDETIMVGDSVHDIISAREANIKIISALWDSYAKNDIEELNPDNAFYSVKDLLDYFKKIIN